MKRITIILAMAMTLGLSVTAPKAEAQISASINFQFFYDNLSPHGSWMSYPDRGYVWRPAVSDGFHPYRSDGHWVWTDDFGWTWVSDYDWGWAPFHYGRWDYDPYYGWVWAPGYEWSPAWVTWRSSPDYYGWAPLGSGISFNFLIGGYNPPATYWSFVPSQYIASPMIYSYYASPAQNVTIINKTKIINNYSFRGGPEKNVFVNGPTRVEAEKRIGGRLQSAKFTESNSPGRAQKSDSEVAMFKPKVNDGDKRTAKPAKAEAAANTKKGNDVVRYDRSTPQTNEAKTQKNNDRSWMDVPKTNNTKKQPAATERTKSQPVKEQPVRTERTQPKKEQPVRTEPTRQQPRKEQPVRTEATRQQPQKSQPVKTEPMRQQQQPRSQPAPRTEPVRQQSQKSHPAQRTEPVKQQQSAPAQQGGGQSRGKKNK